jgi:hypothetical protein
MVHTFCTVLRNLNRKLSFQSSFGKSKRFKLIIILVIFYFTVKYYLYHSFDVENQIKSYHEKDIKVIQLLTERFHWKNWNLKDNLFDECEEKRCSIIKPYFALQKPLENVDGVIAHIPNLYYANSIKSFTNRNSKQLWMFYTMEPQRLSFCSIHYSIEDIDNVFNLTATFKQDSNLITDYKEFRSWRTIHFNPHYNNYYKQIKSENNENVNSILDRKQIKINDNNILWFVSHCETPSRREDYVNKLSNYIPIDIYGTCGYLFSNNNNKQNRNDPCLKSKNDDCSVYLFNSYKYYLAFEVTNLSLNKILKFFIKLITKLNE